MSEVMFGCKLLHCLYFRWDNRSHLHRGSLLPRGISHPHAVSTSLLHEPHWSSRLWPLPWGVLLHRRGQGWALPPGLLLSPRVGQQLQVLSCGDVWGQRETEQRVAMYSLYWWVLLRQWTPHCTVRTMHCGILLCHRSVNISGTVQHHCVCVEGAIR